MYVKVTINFIFLMSIGCFIAFIIFMIIKIRNKKREKAAPLISAIMTIALFLSGIYFSFDAVYQDYVTDTGIFIRDHRQSFYHVVCFDTGAEKYPTYNIFSKNQIDISQLKKGTCYKYQYAKRTRVLLSIEPCAEEQHNH